MIGHVGFGAFEMHHPEAAANCCGRAFEPAARGFENGECAADFAVNDGGGIIAFGSGKMNDGVGSEFADNGAHEGTVGHVGFQACIAFAAADGPERGRGIGFAAAIDVEHVVAAFDREPNDGRPDKSATASHEDAHRPQPPSVNDCAAPG